MGQMNELEVRRTVDLYRSMLRHEPNGRRRTVLSELLMQEEHKLAAIEMSHHSGQDL
jgi:hypothetical protein